MTGIYWFQEDVAVLESAIKVTKMLSRQTLSANMDGINFDYYFFVMLSSLKGYSTF